MARLGQHESHPFLDIEATVDAGDDEEEGEDEDEDGMFEFESTIFLTWCRSGDFIENELTLETQYTSWRHVANMDENSDEGGWGDLVASIEKRYALDSGIAERNHNTFESHPIAPSIDNIIQQLPHVDDYPSWRIRCKVTLSTLILHYITICLARLRRRDCFFFTSDDCATA